MKFLAERLIKAGHLRTYVREVDRIVGSRPLADRVTAGVVASSETRPSINYILGGMSDD